MRVNKADLAGIALAFAVGLAGTSALRSAQPRPVPPSEAPRAWTDPIRKVAQPGSRPVLAPRVNSSAAAAALR